MMKFKYVPYCYCLVFFSLHTLTITAHAPWTACEQLEPITIYYQGILNSQVQCAKYIGPQTLHTTTGERVRCQKNIDCMLHPFIGVELDDVHPVCNHTKPKWYHYLNPAQWIESWLHKRSMRDNVYATITVENPTPHKKIARSLSRHSNSLSMLNFGQEYDIANHKKKWDACQKLFPNNPKILWGVSRGAATTFNAMAHNKLAYKHVALVIVEGCYDSIYNTICDRMHPFAKKFGLHKTVHALLSLFTKYNPGGISPLKAVNSFPEHIPVVFVTSKADTVVPAARTKNIAKALATRGKNDVYLIELTYSSHKGYTVDDARDMRVYQHALHAIYKKLDLPHVPEYAQEYADRVNEFLIKV